VRVQSNGRRMPAAERLQLRLLVGADHVLAGSQPLALKGSGVEVEHPAGLLRKGGVTRKDPRARLPRLDRVLVQPAPDRRRRRVRHAALHDEAMQLTPRELRQQQPAGSRQLARDRLDLGDLLRAGNGAGDPRAACPLTPQADHGRTVFATSPQSPRSYPTARRSPCPPSPHWRKARSSRATPLGRATSPPAHDASIQHAPAR
jgi:hypothetical protein